MDLNSRLFDRIRIKPACDEPRRAANARCDHEGCPGAGEFRAPKGRGQEGRYFRFCLQHVREYNQSYNYFTGMSDTAVADFQRDAVVGHRPTWDMRSNGRGRRRDGAAPPGDDFDYLDPFGTMGSAGPTFTRRPAEPPKPSRPGPVLKALETLGLDEGADASVIKAQYKVLVKRFHPDAHGGDRSYEERLRDIITAHDTLKAAGLC